jgi:hypothetical protein
MGMSMSLSREGYMREAQELSTDTAYEAMANTLLTTFMNHGTLGLTTGPDGKPWCILTEILSDGTPGGAIFYALSIKPFLRRVTMELLECIRDDD